MDVTSTNPVPVGEANVTYWPLLGAAFSTISKTPSTSQSSGSKRMNSTGELRPGEPTARSPMPSPSRSPIGAREDGLGSFRDWNPLITPAELSDRIESGEREL